MTFTFDPFPGGYVLAPCLATLDSEVAQHPFYSKVITNLGELGDAAHQQQGCSSDHNPCVIGPRGSSYPGRGYVRAQDFGGPYDALIRLRAEIHKLYVAQDPRIYPFGYCKGPDSQITKWFSTVFQYGPGDEGHLHVSVNQSDGYNPSPGGYVPALDSRKPWGLLAPVSEEDDMFVVSNGGNFYLVQAKSLVRQLGAGAARIYGQGRQPTAVTRDELDRLIWHQYHATKNHGLTPAGTA